MYPFFPDFSNRLYKQHTIPDALYTNESFKIHFEAFCSPCHKIALAVNNYIGKFKYTGLAKKIAPEDKVP